MQGVCTDAILLSCLWGRTMEALQAKHEEWNRCNVGWPALIIPAWTDVTWNSFELFKHILTISGWTTSLEFVTYNNLYHFNAVVYLLLTHCLHWFPCYMLIRSHHTVWISHLRVPLSLSHKRKELVFFVGCVSNKLFNIIDRDHSSALHGWGLSRHWRWITK